jgi:hypothetical protein
MAAQMRHRESFPRARAGTRLSFALAL